MFIEPHSGKRRREEPGSGWIEVVCGSMFSGKTEELIRRLNRALIAGQRVEIFKPAIDTRYHVSNVVSHNDNAIRSSPVSFAEDIMLLAGDSDVVGIDEAQFFDEQIIEVCTKLANKGKRVIVAGLDMDSNAQPFGPLPGILAVAEYVTKLHAICMQCGSIANYSYRLVNNTEKVMLGEKETYEARCRKCYLYGQQDADALNKGTKKQL